MDRQSSPAAVYDDEAQSEVAAAEVMEANF